MKPATEILLLELLGLEERYPHMTGYQALWYRCGIEKAISVIEMLDNCNTATAAIENDRMYH